MKRFAVRFGIALGAVLLVTFLTLLPMCNLMFSCGCTFLGAAHCNIHHATGPMCPWCAHRNAPFLIGYGVTLSGAAGSILAALKRRAWSGGLILAVGAGVAGYVGTLSVCGLATALYFHYPTWCGLHLLRFYR